MKKLISFIMVLSLFGITVLPVHARETGSQFISIEDREGIIDVLSYVEQCKEEFGLSDIDFTGLSVGAEIPMYEFSDTGFEQIRSAYPIYFNDKIKLMAIKVVEHTFQINVVLAEQISALDTNEIAILYDLDGCYLYDGTELHLFARSDMEVMGRERIYANPNVASNLNSITLAELNDTIRLNYSSNPQIPRTQIYYSCNISYITQNPYDNICWAATTASIVNYVKGKSLSAVDVAKAKFGNTNFNQGLSAPNIAGFMNSQYSMGYTYHGSAPSDNTILKNIQDGYPLVGVFSGSSQGIHACAIYGVNPVAGYISIMDPKFGSATGTVNDGYYTYVDTSSALTLRLNYAISKNW